jgi:hypothetical protein
MTLFAKAGAAYVDAKIQSTATVQVDVFQNAIGSYTSTTGTNNYGNFWSQINPVVGVGQEYFFSPHFSISAEYDYYFSVKLTGGQAVNSGTLSPSIVVAALTFYD